MQFTAQERVFPSIFVTNAMLEWQHKKPFVIRYEFQIQQHTSTQRWEAEKLARYIQHKEMVNERKL